MVPFSVVVVVEVEKVMVVGDFVIPKNQFASLKLTIQFSITTDDNRTTYFGV